MLKSFILRYGRTQVFFGLQAVKEIQTVLEKTRRVLIVTGRRSAIDSGALQDVLMIASKLGLETIIYQGVEPNPSVETIDAIAEKAWRNRCEMIVAVGGGSVIDASKLASVIAVCGCNARDYLTGKCVACDSLELVAVNLTHGTGSEVDRYSVVSDYSSGVKIGIASDNFYPVASFDDPRYTTTLSREQTIYTSLDALYHFIEASTSRNSSPFVVSLAREGVKLIAEYLPQAVANPNDLVARYWLMYASLLAGIAIDNARTHVIHALEHVVTGINPKLAHGAGLGILGPISVKHICREALEICTDIMTPLLGDVEQNPTPEAIASSLLRFQRSVGFREKLADYGFTSLDASMIAEKALKLFQVQLSLAPFEVTRETLEGIYYESLKLNES